MFNNVLVFLNIVKHTLVSVKQGGLVNDVTLEIRVTDTTCPPTFTKKTIDSTSRFKSRWGSEFALDGVYTTGQAQDDFLWVLKWDVANLYFYGLQPNFGII